MAREAAQHERRPSTSLGGRRDVNKAILSEPAMEAGDEAPGTRSKNEKLQSIRTKRQTMEAPRGRGGIDSSTSQIAALMASAESRLQEQLLIACEKGNRHAAYLLLHQGIDRDRCRGMRGFTPLHHAATRGHLDVLQLLLEFGWPVDSRNDANESALHLACFNGHLAIAECLLDRGASINAITDDNETPLFYAARKSHYRIVRLLIRRECDRSVVSRFGDRAEDESVDEKTQLEFTIGKEDTQRLYNVAKANNRHRQHSNNSAADPRKDGEQALAQRHREHILSFLDLMSLCKTSQVAYRWHRAADSPSLWRRLGVSRWELLLNATMGMGLISPMATMNFARTSNKNSKRPSSCDQGISANRYMAPSVQRRSSSVYRDGGSARPQTARLCTDGPRALG